MYLIPKPKELVWRMGECFLPYAGEIVTDVYKRQGLLYAFCLGRSDDLQA